MPAKALMVAIRWARDKDSLHRSSDQTEENETAMIDWQMELLLSAKRNNGVVSLVGLRRRTFILGERSMLTAH